MDRNSTCLATNGKNQEIPAHPCPAHDRILRCRINAAFRSQVERRIYAAERGARRNSSCAPPQRHGSPPIYTARRKPKLDEATHTFSRRQYLKSSSRNFACIAVSLNTASRLNTLSMSRSVLSCCLTAGVRMLGMNMVTQRAFSSLALVKDFLVSPSSDQ